MNNSIIKIMNYNLWANDLFIEQRLSNLTGLIYYHNCDVLCFQDLNPFIFNKLIHNLGLNYPHIVSTPELEKDYGIGLAIFSKHKIIKYESIKLVDSTYNKYILLAKIKKSDNEYNICNLQLEDTKSKNKQFENILNNLNSYNNMIITGDFKIKEEENHYYNFNTNIWKDSWTEDGEEESKKFTSDFKTNIFVKRDQNRFDRILYKKNDLELTSFQIIGKNYNPTPSNRYGLFISLRINDSDLNDSEIPLISTTN